MRTKNGIKYLSAEKKEIKEYVKSHNENYTFTTKDFAPLAELINKKFHNGCPVRTVTAIQAQVNLLRWKLRWYQAHTVPSGVILPKPPATEVAFAFMPLSTPNAAAVRSLLKKIQAQKCLLRQELRRRQPPAAPPAVILSDPPNTQVPVTIAPLSLNTALAIRTLWRSFIKKVQKLSKGCRNFSGGIQNRSRRCKTSRGGYKTAREDAKPLGEIHKPLKDIDRR